MPPQTSRREVVIAYAQSCLDVQDWHGLSDAANDLRELDAETRGVRWARGTDIASPDAYCIPHQKWWRRWSWKGRQ
jgi:hypothetical protein